MPEAKSGTLTVVTRRYVQVCDSEFQLHRGVIQGGGSDACVGDNVQFELDEAGAALVTASSPRSNLLSRSNGHRTKLLAANIDLLLIITAPLPLFNAIAVDRVLAVAYREGIPTCLVCNKSDLESDLKNTAEHFAAYEAIGRLVYCSAKTGAGLGELQALLGGKELNHAVITGVSGVGKSSILNQLIPDVEAATQTVSGRTGQGKQTTSQAIAHTYQRAAAAPLLLSDLPGVQSFGVCHLSEEEIRSAFIEFRPYSDNCRFSNCSHMNEPECKVIPAVEAGNIPALRYKSYSEMIQEVRDFNPYK